MTTRKQVVTATVGTATVITSIAATVGAPFFAQFASAKDTKADRSPSERQLVPQSPYAAVVDSDPAVITAKKARLAAHRAVASASRALDKANAAFERTHALKAQQAVAAAKTRLAKAKKAATAADAAYLRAEVEAIAVSYTHLTLPTTSRV